MTPIVITLFCAALILQLVDHYYHRSPKLDIEGNKQKKYSFAELRKATVIYGKWDKNRENLDNFIGVLPYIWTYLMIIATAILFHMSDSIALDVLLILFITGRYRSLQEIGHQAVHGALMPNRKLAMKITDYFYQYPLFMVDAKQRRITHVKIHHNTVNMEHDPDLAEMRDVGFKPGITRFQFLLGVIYPLTPKGIMQRLKECSKMLLQSEKGMVHWPRTLITAAIVFLFSYFGFYWELIFLYVVPVLFTYPLFYWIAHIALHRWYKECDDNIAYHERELILGRPTVFKGITGFIVKHNIFPVGDSYHLAHSLFPSVRWNHLPSVDRLLRENIEEYEKNESVNLFFPSRGKPSAISELQETMVLAKG